MSKISIASINYLRDFSAIPIEKFINDLYYDKFLHHLEKSWLPNHTFILPLKHWREFPVLIKLYLTFVHIITFLFGEILLALS